MSYVMCRGNRDPVPVTPGQSYKAVIVRNVLSTQSLKTDTSYSPPGSFVTLSGLLLIDPASCPRWKLFVPEDVWHRANDNVIERDVPAISYQFAVANTVNQPTAVRVKQRLSPQINWNVHVCIEVGQELDLLANAMFFRKRNVKERSVLRVWSATIKPAFWKMFLGAVKWKAEKSTLKGLDWVDDQLVEF